MGCPCIVTVPKQDGQIWIYGDYKVTINLILDVNQYPLPKPEDIFTRMPIVHYSSCLLLDEESRKFVTINSHKGLYRLPLGIISAPAVFQHVMDTVLEGIDGVACYSDDIIITGKMMRRV